MKHLLKNTFALHLLAMVTSMLIVGCEQDPQIKKYVYPMPEVSGMTPSIGYVTSQVVITGTNFGDRTESVKVLFGGVQATKVLMCKNNRIAVEVPENAVSGDVTLQVWTNEVGVIGQYTVLPTPHIQAVVSDNESGAGVAEPGDKVTILGENFGTDASLISVDFNGTPATDIALIDEKTIEATTPVGYASGNVTVTIRGYEMKGSALFNPTMKGDVTMVYLQNYKQPFATTGTGEWTDPNDWNQSMKNPTGCRQEKNGVSWLVFQKGWGKTDLIDAKVWQTTQLRKGTYRMEISYTGTYVPNKDGNRVVALIVKGAAETSIPTDLSTITAQNGTYVAFNDWDKDGVEGIMKTPSFTLEEASDVVIGFLTTIKSSNTYFKAADVKLILE